MKEITVIKKNKCNSSTKAIKFLKDNGVPHRVKRLESLHVTEEWVMDLLKRTGEGSSDLLVKSAGESVHLTKELGLYTTKELVNLVVNHPRLLKTPIVIEGDKTFFGFSEEELRTFFTRKHKYQELKALLEKERKMSVG